MLTTRSFSFKSPRSLPWLLILVLALGGYTLLLAEGFLRVFNPMPVMPRYVSATDYGIRGNKPNAHYKHTTPDYSVEFNINEHGVRTSSTDLTYEKPKGVKRIVGLGDSFMLGYGATESQTFISQMAQEIQTYSDCKVEFINLGVSGHGTSEELLTLAEEGLKYKPDLVLLSWHHTDIKDNVRCELYKLGEDGKLLKSANQYLPSVALREKLFSNAAYRFIAEHSHLYSWIREWLGDLIKNLMSTLKNKESTPSTLLTQNKLGSTADKKLAASLINAMHHTATTNDSAFLVLEVPRKTAEGFQSTLPKQYLHSNIVSYSPISDFNKIKPNQTLYWKRSAGHFTPKGNEIVGIGLARTAQMNGLINCD